MEDTTEDFTTEELSNALDDQERIAKYLAGEYCPVVLGETFKHGRYRVVHKLGWGGYSTVWLARDEEFHKWVAIKIAAAQSSTQERAAFSVSQTQALQDVLNHPSDVFKHAGPTGIMYKCFVYTLLGPSVDQVVWDYCLGGEALEPEIIIKLTTQLLRIVARTHGAGIVHGDISGSNLVFEASNVQDLDEAELLDILGHPKTAKIVRKDGQPLARTLPTHMVEKTKWDDWVDEDEEDIRLIDWDQAFDSAAGSPGPVYQPHDMRAPETILKGHFDLRSDLWQVGCTIHSFVFASRPFWTFANEKHLLEQIHNFVEPFAPEQYQPDEDGSSSQEEPCTNSRQESELERKFRERVEDPEVKRLLPIIQGLMRINPGDRISAEEAFQMLEAGIHDNET